MSQPKGDDLGGQRLSPKGCFRSGNDFLAVDKRLEMTYKSTCICTGDLDIVYLGEGLGKLVLIPWRLLMAVCGL